MAGTKIPVFDWDKLEFMQDAQGNVVTATGGDAVKQITVKAQHTARGVFVIYADIENDSNNHKYGTDVFEVLKQTNMTQEALLSEVARAVKEALTYDPWITAVSNVNVYAQLDDDGVTRWYADYIISTIYDKEVNERGVILNG